MYHVSLASVGTVDVDLLAQAKRLWDGWSDRLVAALIAENSGYILVGGDLGRCEVLNAIFRRGSLRQGSCPAHATLPMTGNIDA